MRWTKSWALVALVTLAGCSVVGGGSTDEGEDLSPYEETIQQAVDDQATAPAKAVKDAINGGTITVLSSESGPESLENTTNSDVRALRNLVSRGLTQYRHEDGRTVLVPDLATDLGRPNKARTQWTFTLREGVLFEDGSPITSAEVAAGLKALELENGEPALSVAAPTDSKVVITTEEPLADLPHLVAAPNFSPVAEQDTLASGPYKIAKLTSEVAVLLRNDQWNPDTDTTRHQYPDKWLFDFNRNPDEVQQRVIDDGEDGQQTIVPDPIPADVADQAGERLISATGRCVEVTYLDSEAMPPEVRQAVLAATPSESASLLPTGMPGRKDVKPNKQGDSVESRKLLEGADELRFTLTFYAVDDDEGEAASKADTTAYEKAGFQVETVPISRTEFDAIASGSESPGDDVNMWPGELCASWPTGGGVFGQVVDSEDRSWSAVSGIETNMAKIEAMAPDKSMASWGAFDQQLLEDLAPAVPLRDHEDTALVGSRIGNAQINPITGEPDYSSMYLAE